MKPVISKIIEFANSFFINILYKTKTKIINSIF
jgi:hypothetical protein